MEASQSTRAVATLLLARVLHQLHLVKCAALSYRYAKRGTCTFMIACFMLLVACRMSHSHRMSTCSRIACRTSQAHVACNSMIVVFICANGVRMVFEFIRMYRAHKHVTICRFTGTSIAPATSSCAMGKCQQVQQEKSFPLKMGQV